jgi:hypothetical protein
MAKAVRLLTSVTRKFVSKPGEAWLLLRMAWWVSVLSVTARFYSLPRALEIVAGKTYEKQPAPAATNEQELARAVDLLLSADFLILLEARGRASSLSFAQRNSNAHHLRRAQ